MIYQIKTDIIIDAPIERVWSVLLDFGAYKVWNPFITNIEGMPLENSKIKVTVKPSGQKPMSFSPKIILLNKNGYKLSWLGKVGFTGIFDGHHQFTLKELGPNQVKFIHHEIFSGILAKPIFSKIGESSEIGFNEMNQALKARCENK